MVVQTPLFGAVHMQIGISIALAVIVDQKVHVASPSMVSDSSSRPFRFCFINVTHVFFVYDIYCLKRISIVTPCFHNELFSFGIMQQHTTAITLGLSLEMNVPLESQQMTQLKMDITITLQATHCALLIGR